MKVLVFHGPAHHAQLLRPVEEALTARGAEVIRYTADTEGAFQIALQEECGDDWLWLNDFADEAKGRSLYREQVPYFRDLLLEQNALSMMLPQVFDRLVYFICREWVATRAMLKKLKPDRTLALHELNRWGMMLGALSQKSQTPFFTLQEGLYYGDPWIYTGIATYSTALLLWGQATKEKLLSAGCPEEKLTVVGHPDITTRIAQGRRGEAELWKELPPQAQGRRLVFLFLSHLQIDVDFEDILAGLDDSPWFVIVRSHQLSGKPQMEGLRAAFAKHPDSCFFSELPFAHHWRAMAAAEVGLVIGCSTTFAEWATTGKPLGQIRVTAHRQYRDFAAEGVAVDCAGLPLLQAITKTLAEWPQHQAKAAEFSAHEIADGSAAGQIAERILQGEPWRDQADQTWLDQAGDQTWRAQADRTWLDQARRGRQG